MFPTLVESISLVDLIHVEFFCQRIDGDALGADEVSEFVDPLEIRYSNCASG